MSSVAEHKRRIREHVEELRDAITIGVEKRPATIGFHASACAMEMLEMYLHAANLISTGKKVNHLWFRRPHESQKIEPLIERKLAVSFQGKEKIYDCIYAIEERRDNLIYGKPSKGEAEKIIAVFEELKTLMEKKLRERGESLE